MVTQNAEEVQSRARRNQPLPNQEPELPPSSACTSSGNTEFPNAGRGKWGDFPAFDSLRHTDFTAVVSSHSHSDYTIFK